MLSYYVMMHVQWFYPVPPNARGPSNVWDKNYGYYRISRQVKSCHKSKDQVTNDSFTIWDSTFRKQTRCTTKSWSSKQSSQDIIIGNIQTMKASDCVIPPQLRSIHGWTVGIEQLDSHTHRTHVKFPKQDITSSVQLLALSHDIFIILAAIT